SPRHRDCRRRLRRSKPVDALQAAKQFLPWWVEWGNLLFFLPLVCLGSLAGAAAGAWLALRPMRRRPEETWVRRAQLADPARVAATINVLILPVLMASVAEGGGLAPVSGPPFVFLTVLAALAGPLAVQYRVERLVRGRSLAPRAWLRGLACLWLVVLPNALAALVTLAAVPALCGSDSWAALAG